LESNNIKDILRRPKKCGPSLTYDLIGATKKKNQATKICKNIPLDLTLLSKSKKWEILSNFVKITLDINLS
jgi:hypothetical protein